jgi:hypothetical protein
MNDTDWKIEVIDRLARIETSVIERQVFTADHGPRIASLETWRTRIVAVLAVMAALAALKWGPAAASLGTLFAGL